MSNGREDAEYQPPEPLPLRRIHYGGDATVWVWICYGLAQAVITMLMAFDVIDSLTAAEVVTAVTLVLYVAVNELLVRPARRRLMAESTPISNTGG